MGGSVLLRWRWMQAPEVRSEWRPEGGWVVLGVCQPRQRCRSTLVLVGLRQPKRRGVIHGEPAHLHSLVVDYGPPCPFGGVEGGRGFGGPNNLWVIKISNHAYIDLKQPSSE